MSSSCNAAFGLVILIFLAACLLLKGSLWVPFLLLLSLFVGLPALEFYVLRRMFDDRWLRGSVLAGALFAILGVFSAL